MTAHSISILLQLKMSSFGPYTETHYTRQLHSLIETMSKAVPQRRGTRAAEQGSK